MQGDCRGASRWVANLVDNSETVCHEAHAWFVGRICPSLGLCERSIRLEGIDGFKDGAPEWHNEASVDRMIVNLRLVRWVPTEDEQREPIVGVGMNKVARVRQLLLSTEVAESINLGQIKRRRGQDAFDALAPHLPECIL